MSVLWLELALKGGLLLFLLARRLPDAVWHLELRRAVTPARLPAARLLTRAP